MDPADSTERHQRAATDRRVDYYPGEDGMATIWALLPAADAQAVMTCLDGLAGRVPATDDRSMDQRRADALTNLALEALDRVPAQHGRRPAIQVTVALSTLLGRDQQPAELAGYGPIPADTARDLAFDPTSTWTRLVTDPCGRLLDVGTTTYRPPAAMATLRDRPRPNLPRTRLHPQSPQLRPRPHDPLAHRPHQPREPALPVQPTPPSETRSRLARETQHDGTTEWTTPTGHRLRETTSDLPDRPHRRRPAAVERRLTYTFDRLTHDRGV